MKAFSYTAKDMFGNTIKSSIHCEDYNDFLLKMHDRGLFCISHREYDAKESKTLHKFTTKELSFNCRQLSAMMSSGLTLVKALDILSKEQDKESANQIWREIYEDVQKGMSFSEALKIQRGAFPQFLISMIVAGEASGSLDVVMTRMSDHFAKENKMNNKIKNALAYPIILGILTITAVIVMFTFVFPMFMEMFDLETLPELTKVMFGIVTGIRSYWYIIIIGLILIVMAIIYSLKVPSVRLKFDRFLIKGPLFGKLVVKIYTGRLARTLSSLYSSGIPMVECLERSSAVLGNSYISKCFETVIENVKQGETLSSSIQSTGIFDSMFCSIIYTGEESGALDNVLTKTAEYYEDESDSAIQKLVTYIEPMMIIFLGIVVCLVLVSILPAMYSMYKNIG